MWNRQIWQDGKGSRTVTDRCVLAGGEQHVITRTVGHGEAMPALPIAPKTEIKKQVESPRTTNLSELLKLPDLNSAECDLLKKAVEKHRRDAE